MARDKASFAEVLSLEMGARIDIMTRDVVTMAKKVPPLSLSSSLPLSVNTTTMSNGVVLLIAIIFIIMMIIIIIIVISVVLGT